MLNAKKTNREKILFLAQFGILLALEAVVCFTPLGSLPIGPMVATLSMLPVILAGVLLGTKASTLMGFFFGLFSFIVWTFTPPPTSAFLAFVYTPFVQVGNTPGNFWSLVICFVPRILAGLVSGLCFSGFSKLLKDKKYKNGFIYTISGVLGSLTNTILVLGGIVLFFGNEYAAANNVTYTAMLIAILTTVVTNGLLEAIIGGIVAWGVGRPVKKYVQRVR